LIVSTPAQQPKSAAEIEESARATMGQAAMKLVADYGCNQGEAVIRGAAAAFTIALASFIGPNETRRFLDSVLPRPTPDKPRLVG
jgi:hypothetical protein